MHLSSCISYEFSVKTLANSTNMASSLVPIMIHHGATLIIKEL